MVWYRVEWEQFDSTQPTGLMLEYLCLAGEVRINGMLVGRDSNLVPPLTRGWNTPHYWPLTPPLLHPGRNTMLVRVSGLAAYQPGIGPVTVGPAASVQTLYAHQKFVRVDSEFLNLGMNITISCVFLVLWIFRRREVTFGWYGLTRLFWVLYECNQVATSTWPLSSDRLWEALNTSFFLLCATSSVIFTLRFCERRFPRWEVALWLATGMAAIWMLATPPETMGQHRAVVSVMGVLIGFCGAGLMIYFAWRSRVVEQVILAGVSWVGLLAGLHDLLTFLNVLHGNIYYSNTVSTTRTIAIAAVLAWRYVRNANRIENFNAELRQEVEAARASLRGSLEHRHMIELTHARIGERLNLVRDLHDGLGSTLIGGLAAVEHAPEGTSASYLTRVLKEVRDDLRLIIDSSGREAAGEAGLAEQIVPLRHRMTQLLDAHDIDCRWTLTGLDDLLLSSSQVLDVLRFLQEALTNALKHSEAKLVQVAVQYDGSSLSLSVLDNGKGVSTEAGQGVGMQSMGVRARRLGGELHFASEPGRTLVAIQAASLSQEPRNA